MTFTFSDGSGNFRKFFPSPEKFLLCTSTTVFIDCQDLVQRLRIGDCFEIHILRCGLCDPQLLITIMFRSGYDCTKRSSARSPCYFCLQAHIAIRTLRKVRVDTVLTRTRFHFCSRLHKKFIPGCRAELSLQLINYFQKRQLGR